MKCSECGKELTKEQQKHNEKIAAKTGTKRMDMCDSCWWRSGMNTDFSKASGMDLMLKTPRMKKERRILNKNILVDRSTGHGEPADYYERKPYNGEKWIDMRYTRTVKPVEEGGAG